MNAVNAQIETILADPTASFWLKAALRSATNRDCIDAYYDAKALADVLKEIMDNNLGR